MLADDGIGYINQDGGIQYVTGLAFNESMSDILVDFEGNYWMTSYPKRTSVSRSKQIPECDTEIWHE